MLTLSLEEVFQDPTDVLASILSFVWREDWEWEGHGGGGNHPNQGLVLPRGGSSWKHTAEDLILNHHVHDDDDDDYGSLDKLLEQTSLILEETSSSAINNDGNSNAFQKSIQGAFASEMQRSQDMTAWPCPSFWEGVESSSSGGDDGDNQIRVLRHISGEMVPNCKDDDPFVRCTVNKDRCEVKGDAKCK